MSKSATLIKATGQQIHATRIVQMLGHIFQPTPQHPCFRAVQEDMIRGLQLAFTEAAPRNNHAPSLHQVFISWDFPMNKPPKDESSCGRDIFVPQTVAPRKFRTCTFDEAIS